VAWKCAIEKRTGPSSLIFSRQNHAHQPRTEAQMADIARGGYVLLDCDGSPDVILIATGSEVELAVNAAKQLSDKKIRVVSMPAVDVFEMQDESYREAVLPSAVTARVVIEAGVTSGWYKYAGCKGKVLGIDRFGESAPGDQLMKYFGMTVENVVKTVESVL
jgi:transketolase